MTVKSLIDYLSRNVNTGTGNEFLFPAINSAIRQIAFSHAWSWLRRTIAVTTTATDTAGFLMPSNMINVMDPIIDASHISYQRIDPANALDVPSPHIKYFSFDPAATTPLIVNTVGVSIDKNTTALTFSPALAVTSNAGEFIQLIGNDGEDWGIHELASDTDLVNTYKGGRINDGYYSIRPSITKRLSFTDYTGVRIAATPTVQYWVFPEPILAPEQELPDIWEEPLKFKAATELQTETWDKKGEFTHRSMEERYMEALSTAIHRDPAPPLQRLPMGNDGRVLSMGWRHNYAG